MRHQIDAPARPTFSHPSRQPLRRARIRGAKARSGRRKRREEEGEVEEAKMLPVNSNNFSSAMPQSPMPEHSTPQPTPDLQQPLDEPSKCPVSCDADAGPEFSPTNNTINNNTTTNTNTNATQFVHQQKVRREKQQLQFNFSQQIIKQETTSTDTCCYSSCSCCCGLDEKFNKRAQSKRRKFIHKLATCQASDRSVESESSIDASQQLAVESQTGQSDSTQQSLGATTTTTADNTQLIIGSPDPDMATSVLGPTTIQTTTTTSQQLANEEEEDESDRSSTNFHSDQIQQSGVERRASRSVCHLALERHNKLTGAQLDNLSSLIKIIRFGSYDEFLEMLERKGFNNLLNVFVDGQTALHYSLIYGRSLAWCRQLILSGANPNLTNRAGWHPIHLAAFNGSRETMRYLIDCIAN